MKEKYPSVLDDNFYDDMSKIYKDYKVPKKPKTFDQVCFPKEYKKQVQQKFLGKFINPSTPYKGVLVLHRIGAGKTCTAISVAEEWIGKRKIICSMPASLKGGFRNEIRGRCTGGKYLSKEDELKLKEVHPSSLEYNEIIEKSNKLIDKNYLIMSHNKLIKELETKELKLNNTLLIIDEIQNLVSESGTNYKILYNSIKNAPRDIRIVLLTATPMFNKPDEFSLTFNLLKPVEEMETGKEFQDKYIDVKINKKGKIKKEMKNKEEFEDKIRGYISYFAGAPPHTFPDRIVKYVSCKMSDFQYKSYSTVMRGNSNDQTKTFKEGQILNLPNDFLIGSRMMSNVSFPDKKIKKDGFKSFSGEIKSGKTISGEYLKMENLKKYSIKFYKIINKISLSKGTVLFYSNFKEYGGIKSFIKVIEAYGYSDYLEYGEGKKRYGVISGDYNDRQKDEIKNVFNKTDNKDGNKIKILILSPASKEGFSAFNVQQFHILEPNWNISRLDQIIGRAVRYCSHKNLPMEERIVRVYIYVATHPSEKETVDEYMVKLSNEKQKLINEFEDSIKKASIDCRLFKNANKLHSNNPGSIKCY